MVYRLPIPYPRTCSSFDCYVRIFGIFNSTTVNLFPFVCWGTGYRRGFYRAAINGNITATAAVTAATNSGTIRRTSSYRTTLNGNITASALLAATNSSTILRTSNYRTTINNNITARDGAVKAATNSGAIPSILRAFKIPAVASELLVFIISRALLSFCKPA